MLPQIGAYQVLFELGRGGMGRVYLGRTVGAGGFERLVAIKRAHPNSTQSEELAQRFLNEARLAGFVHHANVVSMHQAGSDAEGHYLVCDYVEGESLAGLTERARSLGQPPPALVTRILLDGLSGLHAAHEAVDASGKPLGMLHRDVSMDNLLVGRDGVTRLADFGIAKARVSSVVTEQGMLQGKLIYFAPEYLRGLPTDRTIDLYAMGITLWSALAGALPWRGKEEPQLLHAILLEGIPSLASAGIAVDPRFDALIAQACRADPRQRFQSARQMQSALESVAKASCGIASQEEVAEYVERVMGEELAKRRERIRLRREDLDAGPTQRSALQVETLPQAREPQHAPAASIEEAYNPSVVTGTTGRVVREAWRRARRPRRLLFLTAGLLTLITAYALFVAFVRERQPAAHSRPPAAPVTGAAPQVELGPAPASRALAPRGPAAAETAPSEPAPSPAAPPGESQKPPAESAQPAAPASRVNPRAKGRAGQGISTKNPYRAHGD